MRWDLEWLFGGLLLAGFWNKKLGVLGALGSAVHFYAHHDHPIYAGWLGQIGRRVFPPFCRMTATIGQPGHLFSRRSFQGPPSA
jgi:hypothetical protein